MKLSLLCQHQGLFPAVIMVGPRFEQRFEPAMACHTSWFPLLHRDLLLTIMSFTISFFLIGNQRYPPHLWLILGLAKGYLMVRGWQRLESAAVQRSVWCKGWRTAGWELQTATSSAAQILHPGPSTLPKLQQHHGHRADDTQCWWHTVLMQEHTSGTPFWHWSARRWAVSYQQWSHWEELKFVLTWLSPTFKQNA